MKQRTVSERALVLAPIGRDAAIATGILAEAGLEAAACPALAALIGELDHGAGLVVMTEEAIATADLAPFSDWIAVQEEWSDLPIILLTSRGGGLERNPAAARHLDVLGNVTFLERPFHPTTLVSLARSAIRARRRQYEARARLLALQESEARYRTLFENLEVGFCIIEMILDSNGNPVDYRFVEANPAFETQAGFDPAGRRVREIVPDHEQHWFDFYGAVATTGIAGRVEQGSAALGRWWDVHAFRVGRPEQRRVAALFSDITARRNAELRLQEMNETLEALVAAKSAERDRLWNLSQDMLARADFTGMMSAVSPAWEWVLGWTEDELLSRGYASFMHPEDAPPTLEAIARMAATAGPTRFENRIAMRDGGWKPIEWIVAPEPDGHNFIAVGRDLSHMKAREAELEAAQEALRQSQKMEAMGSLTGGVAHDFNNLLTPIIGSLDMLHRKALGSERDQRLIDGALQSAERAKTLVQRLLAFARRQPLQAVAVDLRELVGGMVDLVGSTVGPTIELQVRLADDLPPALADPNQLEMALLNLAVNARDAMDGGGTLTIAASRESQRTTTANLARGHYVRLSVSDTGKGMDEETRRRAIEPFFSTKGIGKGTGLGLSMVHGLAGQLGGALKIDSQPGHGTTMALWLPVGSTVTEADPAPVDHEAAPGGRGVVLVVDDEDLVRMSTAHMLSDIGYEVVESPSAEDALALIRGGLAPDMLVTDHLMPGMTGAELVRLLREERPALRSLIVSGYAEAAGIEAAIPHLTKPFRSADLARSLSALTPATGRSGDAASQETSRTG
ncbi:PAS domain S-box protein [Sphingomonas sp. 2R-10]|uniref:ATP-binding protein n=1 Tax=Sphingomonas sp. 2R-10 TaxID=3045148 RepID=UPI0019D2B5A5|nr:ATP-binding protein [Sphingomonas sp. 2R-10]MDJ0277595.1 PAS domain S-box protein [Sphingomonas sp. 2R-10]